MRETGSRAQAATSGSIVRAGWSSRLSARVSSAQRADAQWGSETKAHGSRRAVSAGSPDQCFAAFLAFLPLCLTLPAPFLALPFTDLAPCLAFLATPMTNSSLPYALNAGPERADPVAAIFHAGCRPNLADIAASSP